MDGEADFSRLEEMAMSHPRRKAPEPASLDRREMYLRALERANAQPEEIESYMLAVDEAQEQWERFERNSPKAADLLRLAKDLDEAAAPFDTRDPDLVTYRIGPVLAVVLLAKICGCTDCEEYADFYFQNHPFLSYAFELPPAGFICAGTIRLILETVPSGTYEDIFKRMFSILKGDPGDALGGELPQGLKRTVGGDGQEVRASFKRGEPRRGIKGAHGVTLYDCDRRGVADYCTVGKKNNEAAAFLKMLGRMGACDGIVFYADALNTRRELIDFLNQRQIDWVFPVKSNGGCRELREDIEYAFEKQGAQAVSCEDARLAGGRLERRKYSFLPASCINTGKFSGIGTLVKVEKHTEFPRKGASGRLREPEDGEICYISSMPFGKGAIRQIKHSLEVRWRYEQHHKTIDTVLMQDRSALCDENHLAAVIGLNKAAYNILTYAREELSRTGYTRVAHRSPETAARARPLSYKRTVSKLNSNIGLALRLMTEYLALGRG